MAPSTSPAPCPPEAAGPAASPLGLEALEHFYRLHAHIYDWTRPLLLFGRRAAVQALGTGAGQRLLDVGCGTGWSLPHLARLGAEVIGIEPSSAMRRQTEGRLDRLGLRATVHIDPRPFGTHAEYEGTADRVLFSYSLSMIPPFADVLERARRDLRPGGRIVVVDFLDALAPMAAALRASHVHLGPERLAALRRLFPSHEARIRSVGLWRWLLFSGAAPGDASETMAELRKTGNAKKRLNP